MNTNLAAESPVFGEAAVDAGFGGEGFVWSVSFPGATIIKGGTVLCNSAGLSLLEEVLTTAHVGLRKGMTSLTT